MTTQTPEFDFEALPVTVAYVGKVSDKEWPHFLWNVTIKHKDGFFTTPYKTGLGLVVKAKKSYLPDQPKKPTNKDVMYSLLSDAYAADMSFKDWCSDYGYSDDSISAFKTYQACCEIAVMLRKTFSREDIQAMRDALADY